MRRPVSPPTARRETQRVEFDVVKAATSIREFVERAFARVGRMAWFGRR
jgi:hypothetical protein